MVALRGLLGVGLLRWRLLWVALSRLTVALLAGRGPEALLPLSRGLLRLAITRLGRLALSGLAIALLTRRGPEALLPLSRGLLRLAVTRLGRLALRRTEALLRLTRELLLWLTVARRRLLSVARLLLNRRTLLRNCLLRWRGSTRSGRRCFPWARIAVGRRHRSAHSEHRIWSSAANAPIGVGRTPHDRRPSAPSAVHGKIVRWIPARSPCCSPPRAGRC